MYQKPRKSNKHFLCYNLLSESEQVSLDLHVFCLFCLQILMIQTLASDFTRFYLFFINYFLNGHGLT